MDKRNSKKTEQTEKKVERKDRGDLHKDKTNKNVVKSDTNDKITHPGGDIDKKPDNTKSVLVKIVENARKTEDQLIKGMQKAVADIIQNKSNIDRDDKRSREKIACKLKSTVLNTVETNDEGHKLIGKSYSHINKPERQVKKSTITKDNTDSSQNSKGSVAGNREASKTQRRAKIKTITSKNDASKIFKAVTFVDQKLNKPAIQVKIPNEKILGYNIRSKSSDATIAAKVNTPSSKVSIEKSILKKRGDRRKQRRKSLVTSPNVSVRVRSPTTEVAKWAPSSINRHTKPYYEAWVNTTLAAISKTAKKDKLFLEKQSFLQNFQRALSVRPDTPDLLYENFTDERYTGRIKVKRR